ncbi:MAG: enoyl-CoA hydratase/isomerase family protein [Myxococcota bacterium]|nr:enoyl-CoA hydratase/isomerase family protein [Myxococcota bacterium]MDW8363829.1 enoyl-CoA hydratase/isomerase family protein [Myxococcales bacterium]
MSRMRHGLVDLEVGEDGVAVVELVNPPANAYSHEMMRDLDDAIVEARFDPRVQVIVLRGHGSRFFCAGADIAMLERADPRWKYEFCLHANETLLRLEQTARLVIAAIEGHCVGGGLEIALAADLRVAAAGTGKIGLPEVTLGVLPGTGGTQRLARLVGPSRAIELMAEGQLWSFEQAHAMGLVNHVWPAEGFAERVRQYARRFCAPERASLAVGLLKRAVRSGLEAGLLEGLALERELQQRLFVSRDAAEGLAAFVQKRRPVFEGR